MKNYVKKHKILTLVLSIIFISLFTVPLNAEGTTGNWQDEVIAETGFSEGFGTEANPYKIGSPEELAYLAAQVNSGTDYSGMYFELTKDIDLSGRYWTPIGNYTNKFTGNFNGNGHEITNVYIGAELEHDSTYRDVGLFGYTDSLATIKNIGVSVSIYSSYMKGYIGGLVGYNRGTIENSYVTGNVTGGQIVHVGGLVGYNDADYRYPNSGVIKNSYATGDVTGGEDAYVGGLAGRNFGTIENSYAAGDVTGGDDLNTNINIERTSVGGLVGYNRLKIENSYSTGNVTGGYNAYAGGLIGQRKYDTINKVYYNTDISIIVGGKEKVFKRGVGFGYDNTISKSQDEMQNITFVETLNGNRDGHSDWKEWGIVSGINNGYPTLLPFSPKIVTNAGLSLNEGMTKLITINELSATDEDSDDTTLKYTITTYPSNGQLENTDNPEVPISSFTQQQLIDNKIQYVHNGSDTTSDSFIFKVADDSERELIGQTFNITVTPIYTVMFKDHDETELKVETVIHGNSATAPVDPSREGYTFTDWDKEFSNVTSDLIVTAQYSINQYTVTFNSNGGSEVYSENMEYGSKVGEPTEPTKENYDFAEWYKEADFKNPWDFNSDTVPAEDITLYAKWIPSQDSITMLSSPSAVETSNSFNQIFTLTINNDTVVGKVYEADISLEGVFTGLSIGEINNEKRTVTAEVYGNLANEGTGIITINQKKLSNRTSELSATVIVTLKPTYIVSYNSNGANTGSIPIDNKNYGQGDKAIVKDNIGNLQKTGYKFMGWNTERDGTGMNYAKGDKIAVESSNIDLYANWVIKEYKVTFKDHDEDILKVYTVIHGNSAIAPVDPNREGYTFTDWDKEFSNVTSDLIVTAQYRINQYTVTFNSNGGSAVNNKIINYNTKVDKPSNPTRSGYTFTGWYEDEALTKAFDFETLIVEDKILYAKWRPISSDRNRDTSSNNDSKSSDDVSKIKEEKENTIVIINGQKEKAGKEKITEKAGGKTVEVQINSNIIGKVMEEQRTDKNQKENIIEVPISTKDTKEITTALTGDIVKKMEEDKFNLSILLEDINYIIPAEEIGIENVAENLDVEKDLLKEIEIEIRINKADEKETKEIEERAKAKGYEIVFPPMDFEVIGKKKTATGGEKQVTVSKFNRYVQRVVKLQKGIDQSKVTTGVVYNEDGTFSHVPTSVFIKDGIYYAKINSLTNSSYSMIWNPITVETVENHWSKKAVNDMASRLVIKNPEKFMPDKEITRGEFAEYITRALGIYKTLAPKMQKFSDVEASHELSDVIQIASEYGIINGCPDGTFKPNEKISREEAMVMYSRAMDIVGLEEVDNARIEGYSDKDIVSEWAYNDVKKTIGAGIFNGRTEGTINPKDTFTCGEAATAIRNLLVTSGLINE